MIRMWAAFILAALSLFFTSCGLLPYEENFACTKGKGSGYCGSVSEVYKAVNGGER